MSDLGAQDGFTTVPAVTAPTEAIAVLASAFALGILLHAGLLSSATSVRKHARTILLHRMRLLLLLIHISVSLFALAQFTVLLLLSTSTCQAGVTITTIFEQLARVGILAILITKVMEKKYNGHQAKKGVEWWILVAGVGIARVALGILVIGFQRTEFTPVCFARPGMDGWPARAQVAVDGILGLYLMARVCMVYRVFSDLSGGGKSVQGKEHSRGQPLGMFLIALANMGWWAGSIPHTLGVGNLAVRIFPFVGTLLLLLAVLRIFPMIVFSINGAKDCVTDGSFGKSHSMRRLASPEPSESIHSRAATGAGRSGDGTGYSPGGSPVVTPRPGDIESNKTPGQKRSASAAQPEAERNSGFVFGSIIGAPTSAALPQARGWALTQGTNPGSSSGNTVKKTLTAAWGGSARGIQSLLPSQPANQSRSIGGPSAISGPLKIGLPIGGGPQKIKTIDLATAASQERQRIDAEFQRAEERRAQDAELERSISTRSNGDKAAQDVRTMDRTTSVKRKALSRKGSAASRPESPEKMSSQDNQNTYSTYSTDNSAYDSSRAQSSQTYTQPLTMIPSMPTPLPRRLASTTLDVAIPSPDILSSRSGPGLPERQETVLFVNQIVYDDPSLVKSLISPENYNFYQKYTSTQGLSSSRSTGSNGSNSSLKRRTSPKHAQVLALTTGEVPARSLTPIMNRKKSLVGARRPRTLFPAAGSPELKAHYIRPSSSHSQSSRKSKAGPPASLPPSAPLPPVPATVSAPMESQLKSPVAINLNTRERQGSESSISSRDTDIDVTMFPSPPEKTHKLSAFAGAYQAQTETPYQSQLTRNASAASHTTAATSILSRNTSQSSYRQNSLLLSRNGSVQSTNTSIPSRNTSTNSRYHNNPITRMPPKVPRKSEKRLSSMLMQQQAALSGSDHEEHEAAKAWVKNTAALVDIQRRTRAEIIVTAKDTDESSETDPSSWDRHDDTVLHNVAMAITPLPAIAATLTSAVMMLSGSPAAALYASEFDDEQGDSDRTQSEVEEMTDDDSGDDGYNATHGQRRASSLYDNDSDIEEPERLQDESPVRVVSDHHHHHQDDRQEFAHLQQVEQTLSVKMDEMMISAITSPQSFAAPRLQHFKLGDTIPTFSAESRRKYGSKRRPPPSPIGWLMRTKMQGEPKKAVVEVIEDEDEEYEEDYEEDYEEEEAQEEESEEIDQERRIEIRENSPVAKPQGLQDRLTKLTERQNSDFDFGALMNSFPNNVYRREDTRENNLAVTAAVLDGRNSLLTKLEMEMNMQENEWLANKQKHRGASVATFQTEEDDTTTTNTSSQVSPRQEPAVLSTYASTISRLSSRISQTFQSRRAAASGSVATSTSSVGIAGLTNWQRQLAQAQLEYVESAPTRWNRAGVVAMVDERMVLKSQNSAHATGTTASMTANTVTDEEYSPAPEMRRSLYQNTNANFMYSTRNVDEEAPSTASTGTVFEVDDLEIEEMATEARQDEDDDSYEYEYESGSARYTTQDYPFEALPATVYCPAPGGASELNWEQEFSESGRSTVPLSPPLVNWGIGMLWTPPAAYSTVIFELSGTARLWTGIRSDHEWTVAITESLRRHRNPRTQISAAVEGEEVKSKTMWNDAEAYEQREKAKRWVRPRLWIARARGLWPEGRALPATLQMSKLVGLWKDASAAPKIQEENIAIVGRKRADSKLASVSGSLWQKQQMSAQTENIGASGWLWSAEASLPALRSNVTIGMTINESDSRRISTSEEQIVNKTNIKIMISPPMPAVNTSSDNEYEDDEEEDAYNAVSASEYEEDDDDLMAGFSPVFGDMRSFNTSWDTREEEESDCDEAFEFDSVPEVSSLMWRKNKVCTGTARLWTPTSTPTAPTEAQGTATPVMWSREVRSSRRTSLKPTRSASARMPDRRPLVKVTGALWSAGGVGGRPQLWQRPQQQPRWRLPSAADLQAKAKKNLWQAASHCAPAPASRWTGEVKMRMEKAQRRAHAAPLAAEPAAFETSTHSLWSQQRDDHLKLQTQAGMVADALWGGPVRKNVGGASMATVAATNSGAGVNIGQRKTTSTSIEINTTTQGKSTTPIANKSADGNGATPPATVPSGTTKPTEVPSALFDFDFGLSPPHSPSATASASVIQATATAKSPMAITMWQQQPASMGKNTTTTTHLVLGVTDTPQSLWTRDRASRTTTSKPERVAPIKRFYNDRPVEKAVGSMWTKSVPVKESVKRPDVTMMRTRAIPRSESPSAGLWQSSSSEGEEESSQNIKKLGMWSKGTSGPRTTNALPAVRRKQQRKFVPSADMPARATGTMWRKDQLALWRRQPGTESWRLPSLPANSAQSLWTHEVRGSGRRTSKVALSSLRHAASANRKSVLVRVDGRLWEVKTVEANAPEYNWLEKSAGAPSKRPQSAQVTVTRKDGSSQLWTVGTATRQTASPLRTTDAPLLKHTVKPRRPSASTTLAPLKGSMWSTSSVSVKVDARNWLEISGGFVNKKAQLWTVGTVTRQYASPLRTTDAPLLKHTVKPRRPSASTTLAPLKGSMWSTSSVSVKVDAHNWLEISGGVVTKKAQLWTVGIVTRPTASPLRTTSAPLLQHTVKPRRPSASTTLAPLKGSMWSTSSVSVKVDARNWLEISGGFVTKKAQLWTVGIVTRPTVSPLRTTSAPLLQHTVKPRKATSSIALEPLSGPMWSLSASNKINAHNVNWLKKSTATKQRSAASPRRTQTTHLWTAGAVSREPTSPLRTTSAPLLKHTVKPRKPAQTTTLVPLTGPMWAPASTSPVMWQRPIDSWRALSLAEIARRKEAKLWLPETASRVTVSIPVGVFIAHPAKETTRPTTLTSVSGEMWTPSAAAFTIAPVNSTSGASTGLWSPVQSTKRRPTSVSSNISESTLSSHFSSPFLSSSSSSFSDDEDAEDAEDEMDMADVVLIRRDNTPASTIEGLWSRAEPKAAVQSVAPLWTQAPTAPRIEVRTNQVLTMTAGTRDAKKVKSMKQVPMVEKFEASEKMWSAPSTTTAVATAELPAPEASTAAAEEKDVLRPMAETKVAAARAAFEATPNPFSTRLRIPSLRRKLKPVQQAAESGSEREEGKSVPSLASPGTGWLRRKGLA